MQDEIDPQILEDAVTELEGATPESLANIAPREILDYFVQSVQLGDSSIFDRLVRVTPQDLVSSGIEQARRNAVFTGNIVMYCHIVRVTRQSATDAELSRLVSKLPHVNDEDAQLFINTVGFADVRHAITQQLMAEQYSPNHALMVFALDNGFEVSTTLVRDKIDAICASPFYDPDTVVLLAHELPDDMLPDIIERLIALGNHVEAQEIARIMTGSSRDEQLLAIYEGLDPSHSETLHFASLLSPEARAELLKTRLANAINCGDYEGADEFAHCLGHTLSDEELIRLLINCIGLKTMDEVLFARRRVKNPAVRNAIFQYCKDHMSTVPVPAIAETMRRIFCGA